MTMQAPLEHWEMVRRDWVPIESLLQQLVPDAENAHQMINRLTHRLYRRILKDLHALRLQRNRVVHTNLAMRDPVSWEPTANRAHQALLNVVHQAQATPVRTQPSGAAHVSHPGVNVDASESSGNPLAEVALAVAVLCVGSWFLQPQLAHWITLVNSYSVAWWVLQVVWLLCWPGIWLSHLMLWLVQALWWLGTGLVTGVIWLIQYLVSHPY